MNLGLGKLVISLWFMIATLVAGPTFAFAAEKSRRNVEVEWEAIEGASKYEVQVIRKDKGSKKPLSFRTTTPSWSATISPGLYSMKIRSFDDRGAPGDWSPESDLRVKLPSVEMTSPKPDAIVKAKDQQSETIKLNWRDVAGADRYLVKIHSTTSDWKLEKEVSEPPFATEMPVGELVEWNVQAIDANGEAGDLNSETSKFQIYGPKIDSPSITKPISKYVSEVEWSAPANSQTYAYELLYRKPKSKKWESVEKNADLTDTKLKLDISRPSGTYRLKVQAYGTRRAPSKVAAMDFETHGGFRDPAALETAIMRDSITKPTNFYAIASYLLTKIKYSGVDLDAHAKMNFDAIGGTGRLGLGYQQPESQWGGFGIVDLSGFEIQGKVFQFSSVEAHATRKLEFGQNGLLLIGAGIFSKELPIVAGSAQDGFTGVGKVRGLGPHGGFTYWFPISQRLGIQTNARVYYSIIGSTPIGTKVESSISYQYGLLGTYRLNSAWMGYAGYAYRLDAQKYAAKGDALSFAQPGELNSLEIQGSYVNLLLEFSF